MCLYVCVSMYVRVCTQTHMHAHIYFASPVKFSVSFFFLMNVFMTEKKKDFFFNPWRTDDDRHSIALLV